MSSSNKLGRVTEENTYDLDLTRHHRNLGYKCP